MAEDTQQTESAMPVITDYMETGVVGDEIAGGCWLTLTLTARVQATGLEAGMLLGVGLMD